MALGVVDLLEVIEVEHQAGPRLVGQLVQPWQEAAVVALGERVLEGHLAQLLFLHAQRGDVLRVAQHIGRAGLAVEHVVIGPEVAGAIGGDQLDHAGIGVVDRDAC
ncbi:hypothetical protein G6F40_014628 [Rhizopus arrhizus]|nr:hypothetical protein G6F40_014628 [Rhizopus arrhizus]